ncbi:DNA primase [Williamsoniiplasma lucivorax]|uniref:DNA primase n=1 Tax=Williamsoniiplasma lucivorax TaxID=209274 RepID=A0A2S5RD17_9MOLU|nr:DNA primase [Williamsoniiplasma lucivorax]PPE05197.1 DNA primase [Williamsoniiplasma lucivorax]
MANISREKIDEILNNVDIVSIISSYIQVQKKGRNFWAVCPFHNDSDPSMSVSPEKKIYKCFSCGASGNALDFVKNYKHLDFVSAVVELAEQVGVDLGDFKNHQVKSKYTPQQEKLFEINEQAMHLFKTILFSGEGVKAIEYLQTRNIAKSEIEYWDIGFASKNIKLYDKLIAKGYQQKELLAAELITIKDGKIYDYFFDRIVFPIKNEDGKVIGFSARTLQDITPKYVNSRETIVFKKSELAYNINNVLKIINMKKELIVLEGFMDVIALKRIGIDHAIALMGTSLSEFHLRLFKQLKVTLKLFLDGDDPGIQATIKIAKKLFQKNIKTLIVNNETKNDPDELIDQGKQELVKELIDKAIHPIKFVIEKLYEKVDPTNPDSLKAYLNETFSFMQMSKDLIVNETFLNELARRTEIDLEIIKKYYNEFTTSHHFAPELNWEPEPRQTNVVMTRPLKPTMKTKQQNGETIAENKILVNLLKTNEFLETITNKIDLIADFDVRMIMEEVIKQYNTKRYEGQDLNKIFNLIEEAHLNVQISLMDLVENPVNTTEFTQKTLDDSFLTLEIFKKKKERDDLDIRLKAAQDLQIKRSYLKMKDALTKEIKKLETRRGNK